MHDVNVCRRRLAAALPSRHSHFSLNRAGCQHTLCAEEKITYIIVRSLTAFASRHVGCYSFFYVE